MDVLIVVFAQIFCVSWSIWKLINLKTESMGLMLKTLVQWAAFLIIDLILCYRRHAN